MKSVLVQVLEKSVEKNGAKTPVTLGHLLNIAKMVDQLNNLQEQRVEELETQAREEAFNEVHRYGS